MSLQALAGRIPEEDFARYADLEQRVALNRALLERFTPGGVAVPIELSAADLPQ